MVSLPGLMIAAIATAGLSEQASVIATCLIET